MFVFIVCLIIIHHCLIIRQTVSFCSFAICC
nr:MAG TPA: hypothetical protein [Caudoviricetes sp.]